jgi:hypothetical protein
MNSARPRRPRPRTRQQARRAQEEPQSTAARKQQHDEPGRRGSGLLAPLRWLARKLSGLVRWVAKRLRAPLRPIARLLMLRSVARHLATPLRWLGHLLAPGKKRGFGFWWLLATLAVAVALGMVVALLLSPVAGLIALLVVAIWALVRRRRKRADRTSREAAARHLAAALALNPRMALPPGFRY